MCLLCPPTALVDHLHCWQPDIPTVTMLPPQPVVSFGHRSDLTQAVTVYSGGGGNTSRSTKGSFKLSSMARMVWPVVWRHKYSWATWHRVLHCLHRQSSVTIEKPSRKQLFLFGFCLNGLEESSSRSLAPFCQT